MRVADDSKRWTRASGSFNQVKWFFIDLNKIEIRTIKTENANEVAYLSDIKRFHYPEKIHLWVFDGDDKVTLYNKNYRDFQPRKPQVLMEVEAKSAQFLNDLVYLEWNSKFEISRVKFKIQVSSNKLFWKTLDIIPGFGPSASKTQAYKYIDKSPKRGGKYYYRIVAIDRMGKEYVQDFVDVRTYGSDAMETIKASIQAGQLQVPLEMPLSTKVILELFDIKRKPVFVREYALDKGSQKIFFNIRHLTEGNYLLEISYDGKLIKKAVKITN